MLTLSRLKEALYYYPQTGEWAWKIDITNKDKAGDLAGTIGNHTHYLGYFKDKEQAVKARACAEKALLGEFAPLA